MGFKDFVKNTVKLNTRVGNVVSADFPFGSFINLGDEDGEDYILFTKPDQTSEKITHDMVKCATVLAMGVIAIQKSGNVTTSIYGTKYLCVLKDGRQAVLTVGLDGSSRVERVLF